MTGKNVAAEETMRITKSAEIRAPSWPLYSFSPLLMKQTTSLGSAAVRSTIVPSPRVKLFEADIVKTRFGERQEQRPKTVTRFEALIQDLKASAL